MRNHYLISVYNKLTEFNAHVLMTFAHIFMTVNDCHANIFPTRKEYSSTKRADWCLSSTSHFSPFNWCLSVIL